MVGNSSVNPKLLFQLLVLVLQILRLWLGEREIHVDERQVVLGVALKLRLREDILVELHAPLAPNPICKIEKHHFLSAFAWATAFS